MIDQLKTCMASLIKIELMKLELIIFNICKRKKRERDNKRQQDSHQEDKRVITHSEIQLESEKASLIISFRVHHSLWVLVQKLGMARSSVTLKDLEIPSIKIES